MATWVRSDTGTLPSALDANVPGTPGTVELGNATAPADFDPDGVTSVRIQYNLDIISGTFESGGGEYHAVWGDALLTLNGVGATLASITEATQTLDDGTNGGSTTSFDATDSSIPTGYTIAQWEGAEINAGTIDWTTYFKNKGGDGVTVGITSVTVTITYTPLGTRAQKGFRWRNDDGNETAATWAAPLNTPINGLAADDVLRLRFLLAEVGGGVPANLSGSNQGYYLAVAKNGAGNWTALTNTPSSTVPYIAASANVTDEGTTTQQLGSGTFRSGFIDEDADYTTALRQDISGWSANEETEVEFVVKMPSSPTAGDTYAFRVMAYDGSAGSLEQYDGIGVALAQIGDGPLAHNVENFDATATSYTTPDLSGAGFLDDMVAVVGIALTGDTYVPSLPSGWTSFYVDSGSNLASVNGRIAYKQLSSETGAVTFTWSGQNLAHAVGFWVVYGADTTTPIELSDWTENTGLTAVATPGTTGGADRRAVIFGIANTSLTSVSPADWQYASGLSTSFIRHGTDYDAAAGSQDYTASRSTSGDLVAGALVFQPTGGGVSGSAAITEGADSSAASGDVWRIGTAAITEGADTPTASGESAIVGSASPTEGADTPAASGESAVTGSSAVTEASDTSAGSGILAYSGSAAVTEQADASDASGIYTAPATTGTAEITEQADTPSAVGDVWRIGSAAVTEGADTPAATGHLAYSGSASPTEAADAPSASGHLQSDGSADITEATDTPSASGQVWFTGSAAVTEAADTSTASGQVWFVGSAAITESADTSNASGTVTSEITEGSAAVTEQPDVPSATGDVWRIGSVAVTEQADTSSGAGLAGVDGTVAVTEGPDTSAASGHLTYPGSAAITEQVDIPAGSGILSYSGTSAASEDPDVAAGSGFIVIEGTVAVTEGADTSNASGGIDGFIPNLEIVKTIHQMIVQKHGSSSGFDLVGALNELAGTSGLGIGRIMTALGAVETRELIGAMNELAGTDGLDLNAAARAWLQSGNY